MIVKNKKNLEIPLQILTKNQKLKQDLNSLQGFYNEINEKNRKKREDLIKQENKSNAKIALIKLENRYLDRQTAKNAEKKLFFCEFAIKNNEKLSIIKKKINL